MASFDIIKETVHKETIKFSVNEKYKIEIREVLRDASNSIHGYKEKTTYYIKIDGKNLWFYDKDILGSVEEVIAYCRGYIIGKKEGIAERDDEIKERAKDIPCGLPDYDD